MPTISRERSILTYRARAYCEDCGWQHFSTGSGQNSRDEGRRHARTHGHRVIVLNERTVAYEGRS